jgi:ribosomal protein L11 methyltransferase
MTDVARLRTDETTARRIASVLGETLDSRDAACAAFEDEAGRWQVAIHCAGDIDEPRLRALVALAAGEEAAGDLRFETVAVADWVRRSLEGLAPVRAGRFVVHGAHDRARVPANAIGIEIEAALAFGTGHHGTTRGCLLALDMLVKHARPRTILDIGTGSGVLAIAAARRLHATVIASDIDRTAVASAQANARLNRTAPYIRFVHAGGARARAMTAPAPYDLIFANILLDPLTRLARPIRRLAAPGAHVVLSGLLPSQANAALAAYRAHGFALRRRIPVGGWMTLLLALPARCARAAAR